MKTIVLIITLGFTALQVNAQKIWTQNGEITFYSKAPLEDIEAVNHSVSSVVDTESGNVAFSLLISAFEFEKALMQEHFNEKYLHSDKYPKSTFKGKITNLSDIDFSTKGDYKAEVEGDLTIHGVTNKVQTTMDLRVKDSNTVDGHAEFKAAVADYNIEIPNMVKDNIAKVVTITVNMNYEPFKK